LSGPADRSGTPSARAVLAGLSWATIGHVGQQVLWFGSLLVLAALVEPEAFGTVALAVTLLALAGALMEAGGTGSIIASKDLTAGGLWRTVRRNVGVGVLLTVALAALAEPVIAAFAPEGDVDAMRVMSLTFVLTGLGIAPMALMQKALVFRRVTAVRVSATSVAAVVAIAAGVLGAGVWALVLRQLLYSGLIALFAWVAARNLLPPAGAARAGAGRPRDARWFALLWVGTAMAISLDNLIVGNQTSAAELGLYTFAFTLGFAPLTQLSWVLGTVLFPSAAASDFAAVGGRTVRAAQLMALVLLPLVPLAVVLAPVLLPAIVGEQWEGSVEVFQLLFAAGVVQAVVNVVGESLSGTGHIAWRAKVTLAWGAASAVATFALVQVDGIRGAALAHVLLAVPLAALFCTAGARRIGTDARAVLAALRPVLLVCAVEIGVVVALAVALQPAGEAVAAFAAATAGAGVVAVAVLRTPAIDPRATLRAVRS
jgi:PST family polysaccharide transporter